MTKRGQPGGHEGLAQLQAMALGGEHGSIGAIGAGAAHVDPIVHAAFAAAMTGLFAAALVSVSLALLLVIAIPNIPLRKHHGPPEPVAEPGEGTDGVVAG